MRMRLLVIWITLTALLQWSRAQEEVSLSGGVENPDADEEKPPKMMEDMTTPPATDMPGVESLTETATGPQVGEQDRHESAEQKGEEPAGLGMGTQDMPSDGSQISVMSGEETAAGSTLPPPKEIESNEKPTNPEPSSSEADILKKPPTSPVRGTAAGLPDYQDDAPYENNSLPVETTHPAPTPAPNENNSLPVETTPPTSTPAPVHPPQGCYSCTNCNATVNDDQKANCKTGLGVRNGCYTMLVKDQNLLTDKRNYVERGCTSEQTEAFFSYCKDQKELCRKCDTNYCNVHDMTSLQVATGGTTPICLLESLLIGSICLVSCLWRQVFY
ncbi:hypothetical protein KR038_006172 [Drosophila bunnanda]|nr:hypothetical protein KR038_006172 [Drosophila bunnanda]